jgi:2C-methyl-D-erythritol 2,4-cyclodiphosphate synthase
VQVVAAIQGQNVALATFNHSRLLHKIEDALASTTQRSSLQIAYVTSVARKNGTSSKRRLGIPQDEILEVGWRVVGLKTDLQVCCASDMLRRVGKLVCVL